MKTSSHFQNPVQQQALNWIIRLNSGHCNEALRHQFAIWLEEDALHRSAFKEVEQFWLQLQGLKCIAKPQLHAARLYLKQAKKSNRDKRFTRFAWATALLSVMLLSLNLEGLMKLTGTHHQTLKGERQNIQLSDGSSIELNTDSELRVNDILGLRMVWLERGEAWFSVIHDEQHPFKVIAGKGQIQDVGTQFNVYRQAEQTTVTVQEGEVSVRTEQSLNILNLTAGKQTAYDNMGQLVQIQPSDINRITAWRNGLLIFKKQPLSEVLEQLSRYHAIKVTVTDPKLQTLAVSGRFSTDNLEQTLDTIASAFPVKVVKIDVSRIEIQNKL